MRAIGRWNERQKPQIGSTNEEDLHARPDCFSLSLARTIAQPCPQRMDVRVSRTYAGRGVEVCERRRARREDEAPAEESKFGWLGSARRRLQAASCAYRSESQWPR